MFKNYAEADIYVKILERKYCIYQIRVSLKQKLEEKPVNTLIESVKIGAYHY